MITEKNRGEILYFLYDNFLIPVEKYCHTTH
nr:MAG TPA: hypothetical protein [Inoviridae sp.]